MWPAPRLALVAAALAWGRPAAAQCPDGSPPPCQPTRRESVVPAPNSIAVLYFDNLTHDSTYAYLADGLTEDLIALLGHVARLDVKSRYESARIRTAVLGPGALGRELHVAYLLGGSVQAGSGRIRVDAELVEARSGRRLWGDRLTVPGTDPLPVQESIAMAVVHAVVGRLLPVEQASFLKRATRDSSAYDLYLRGRFFSSRGDMRHALSLYRLALIHDSTLALAWSGIAQAWDWLAEDLPPLEAFAHGREAAERALALDSSTALAYLSLARFAHQVDRDFARAEALLRTAIALDPRLADAHAFLSWILIDRGQPDEALAESQRAWDLDSLSRTVGLSRWNTLQLLGRPDEVLVWSRADHATLWEVHALLLLRRCREAHEILATVSERSWVYYWEESIAESCLGERTEAQAALDSLTTIARGSYVASSKIAGAHAALGDVDGAFRLLERADEDREFDVLYVNAPWWWLNPVQADPRFLSFVRRLGLPWPAPQLKERR